MNSLITHKENSHSPRLAEIVYLKRLLTVPSQSSQHENLSKSIADKIKDKLLSLPNKNNTQTVQILQQLEAFTREKNYATYLPNSYVLLNTSAILPVGNALGANRNEADWKHINHKLQQAKWQTGLVWAPFVASPQSQSYRQHPEMFLKKNRSFISAKTTTHITALSNKPLYVLDLSNQTCQGWLMQQAKHLKHLGYQHLHLIGLEAALLPGVRKAWKAKENTPENYNLLLFKTLNDIRYTVGKKVILSSNCKLTQDNFSIGKPLDSICLRPINHNKHSAFMGMVTLNRKQNRIESAFKQLLTAINMGGQQSTDSHKHKHFHISSILDVFMSENLNPKQVQLLFSILALSAMPLLFSTKYKSLQQHPLFPQMLQLYAQCRSHPPLAIQSIQVEDKELSYIIAFLQKSSYMGVWNPTKKLRKFNFYLPKIIDATELLGVHDYWRGQILPYWLSEAGLATVALGPFESFVIPIKK